MGRLRADTRVWGGHLEVVKYLVKGGADIHTNNDEPLRCASEGDHSDVVLFLVSRGANLDAGGGKALKQVVKEWLF
jgi:hypothetical protein